MHSVSTFEALRYSNLAVLHVCGFRIFLIRIISYQATNLFIYFLFLVFTGHFLLTNLLLDTLKRTTCESSKEGRIVNVSSSAHRFSYREGIRFDQINDKSR